MMNGKPFNWTYTKLKNFETCAFKHKKVDIDKEYNDGGESLKWGNYVHEAIAKAIRLKCDLIGPRAPLPQDLQELGWQAWIDKIARLLEDGGKLYVEQDYAVDREFNKCTNYYGPDVWHRCRADVVYLNDAADLALAIDWKTGGMRPDSIQLFCMAKVIFALFPEVQRVGTRFAWLTLTGKDGDNPLPETKEAYSRDDMREFWPEILQRVQHYQQALASGTFHTNPSGLCKSHCPVSECGYHGKGRFRG